MRVRLTIFVISFFAFAAAFSSPSNAQLVAKNAHFTLPFDATWQGVVLPAGDYTLSVVKVSGRGVYRVTITGAGKERSVLAIQNPGLEPAKQSMLVVPRTQSGHAISALHLRNEELVFTFPVPRHTEELDAKSPQSYAVPIVIARR